MVEEPKKTPFTEVGLAAHSDEGGVGVAALPNRLARYSKAHQRAVSMADYCTTKDSKLAHKLNHCGHWLQFNHYYTVDQLKLANADFCKKHLLCPLCAIRRGQKYLDSYAPKVAQVISEQPTLKAYMVTLTVKNMDDLAERLSHLRKAMGKMTQARRSHLSNPQKNPHVEFAKAVGGVHSIEIKRGKNSQKWHPHVHMIWLCHSKPSEQALKSEWKHWTGDSDQVNVTEFYGEDALIDGFMEVFKYALKFSDMELEDNWHAFEVCRGKRLIGSFGALRGVEVPDDLTDELLDSLPFTELIFKWGLHVGYTLVHYANYQPNKPSELVFANHSNSGGGVWAAGPMETQNKGIP